MKEQETGPDARERKIRFVYTRAPDYRTVAVSGAAGALTGRGEIRAHLFAEGLMVPQASEVSVDEETGASSERHVYGEQAEGVDRVVEREIQVSIVISPSQAEPLAKWLLARCEEWRELQGKEGNAEEGEADGG